MPLTERALPRVKTEFYWIKLRFPEPMDIQSTTGPVVPEYYRVHVEENNHPESKIVRLGSVEGSPSQGIGQWVWEVSHRRARSEMASARRKI